MNRCLAAALALFSASLASAQVSQTIPMSLTVGPDPISCTITKPMDMSINQTAPQSQADINFSRSSSFTVNCPAGVPYTWTIDAGATNSTPGAPPLFWDADTGQRVFRPQGLSSLEVAVDNRRIGFELRASSTNALILPPGQGAPIGGTGTGSAQTIGFTLTATPAMQLPGYLFTDPTSPVPEYTAGTYTWRAVMAVVVTF